MKRVLLVLGLVLTMTALVATTAFAELAPDCISVTRGDGAELNECSSPDGTAPPEVYVDGVLVGHP